MAELPEDEVEAVAQAAAGAARAGGGVVHVRDALLPELHLLAARVRAEAVADERQRIAALVRADDGDAYVENAGYGNDDWGNDSRTIHGWHRDYFAALVAAGSVPVATPEPEPTTMGPCGHYWATGPHTYTNTAQWPNVIGHCPGPVATPTEPEEPRCLKDGATFEEHYERGITEGREAAAEEAAAAVVKLKTAAGERLALNYTVRDHSRVDDFLAAEQAIRLHFLRAAASPAAEPPAASWGDPAADVMRLVDQTLDGEAPVSTDQPAPWFRETRESLAMLDDVRAEVEAVEAAAEQPEGR